MGCSGCDGSDDEEPSKELGIKQSRSCTDLPCCLIFTLFIVGFIVVALWSFAMGNFARIVHPTNTAGEICGVDVPDRPYLFFFDITKCILSGASGAILGCETPQVCVKECPVKFWSFNKPGNVRTEMICLGGHNADSDIFKTKSVDDLVTSGKCAPYTYPSEPVFGRCLPTRRATEAESGGDVEDASKKKVTKDKLLNAQKFVLKFVSAIDRVLVDLSKTWPAILSCLLFALILSSAWILSMRFMACVSVIATLLLIVLLFATGTGYGFYRWNTLRNRPKSTFIDLSYDLTDYLRLTKVWLSVGIISLILLVCFLFLLIFLRRRIALAIEVLKETGKACAAIPSVFAWPIVPMLLQLTVLIVCIFMGLLLRSIVDPVTHEGDFVPMNDTTGASEGTLEKLFRHIPCNLTAQTRSGNACRFLYYGNRKYTIFLQFFNLFMFFWLINFVKAIGQTTLAGVFGAYYFARQQASELPNCLLGVSLSNAAFWHCGSLAFGSFIIALLSWLRAILDYIKGKLEHASSTFAKCMLSGCCCFLWCLEKCLKFLNRNAYILIAIRGKSFCSSARSAFFLIVRNALRLMVIDKVTDFVMFLGKVIIVAVSSVLVYLLLIGAIIPSYEPEVNFTVMPILIVFIGSYVIVSLFASVFEMGVDTMFLCLLEDLDVNDGSPERPYYMSSDMMRLLDKVNRMAKEKTQKEAEQSQLVPPASGSAYPMVDL